MWTLGLNIAERLLMTESSIRSSYYLPGLNRAILKSEKEKPMNWNLSLSQIINSIGAALLVLTTLSATPILSSSIPHTVTPFCACCVDRGAWSLETREIEDYEMKELNRLTLNGVADFYQTDAENDISGVTAPDGFEYGYFVISIVREQRNWKFFFKTSKSETGALILTLPGKATFFNADIEQGPRPERAITAGLYKEIRLEGEVRGTGIFAKGIAPKTKYRLVLQGGGNWCMRAENFYRWNLRVSGLQAGYTIYGYFAEPSPGINR
jgi:hypothetical protein